MSCLTYIIIDDCEESVATLKSLGDNFQELLFIGEANCSKSGIDLILEYNPKIVFLSIDPNREESQLSLRFIDTLYKYLTVMPKIIVMSRTKELAFDAIHFRVSGYLLKPIQKNEFLQSVRVVSKSNPFEMLPYHSASYHSDFGEATFLSNIISSEKSLLLCVKSYGDYRYIRANEIVYLQADNNSTDIFLQSGEVITAFKTLKHFEGLLQDPFYRIHNSYLINTYFIARIHTGSKMCTLRNAAKKIPFSKSYKTNIELIIDKFSEDNYLEV